MIGCQISEARGQKSYSGKVQIDFVWPLATDNCSLTTAYFFMSSSTTEVMALTPVRSVGSGNGSNRAECSDGNGVPVSLLRFIFAGSTAPNQKSVEGIF